VLVLCVGVCVCVCVCECENVCVIEKWRLEGVYMPLCSTSER